MRSEQELAREIFGSDGVLAVGDHSLVAPLVILWEVTRRCNLRCLHCMNRSGEATEELTTEQARHLVRETAEARAPYIFWSGGEPLLRRDLFDLVGYARGLNVGNVLITNGTLLTRDIVRKAKEVGILKVEVNLDSHDEATYDRFRGHPGAFRDSLAGIEALVTEKMPARANAVLTKVNIDHVPEIVELAQSVGLREVALLPLYPAGRTLDHVSDLEVSQEDVDARKPAWRVLQGELGSSFALCFEGSETMVKLVDPLLRMPGCGAGRIHVCVTPWGDVKPCPAFPDEVTVGNVRETPLRRLWQDSPIFLDLRNPAIPECMDCGNRSCMGGCRLKAYRAYGNFLGGPDPRCPERWKAAGRS